MKTLKAKSPEEQSQECLGMKSPEEKSEANHECRLDYEDFCPVCMKSEDSWGKEFKRRFVDDPPPELAKNGRIRLKPYKLKTPIGGTSEVLTFIRQEISKAEERGYEKGQKDLLKEIHRNNY